VADFVDLTPGEYYKIKKIRMKYFRKNAYTCLRIIIPELNLDKTNYSKYIYTECSWLY
jgi:hypothetical protein